MQLLGLCTRLASARKHQALCDQLATCLTIFVLLVVTDHASVVLVDYLRSWRGTILALLDEGLSVAKSHLVGLGQIEILRRHCVIADFVGEGTCSLRHR